MRIVRAGDCRTTRWKNGGGLTTEIAVSPSDASLDNFDWRISMARVASNGPFSTFPGVDRTLAVLDGQGVELTFGDGTRVVITDDTAPHHFAADVPTTARLISGEITDLNVMSRRGRFTHVLASILHTTRYDTDGFDVAVVIAVSGVVDVKARSNTISLARGDSAIMTKDDAPFVVAPMANDRCFVVLLHDASDQKR